MTRWPPALTLFYGVLSISLFSSLAGKLTKDHWDDIQSLISNVSRHIDPFTPHEDIYHHFKNTFRPTLLGYCSSLDHVHDAINNSLLCDIILNSLRLRSTAIKKALSSSDGTVTTLKYADIKNLSKWSQYLIRIIIEDLTHCPFDINASSCPEDLSPLEYAVLLGETRIANLLLKEGGARVTLKSLQLSITDQDRELINDMLRHLSTDHLSNTDQLVQLGSLHCCLSEQSCDIYENIVARLISDQSDHKVLQLPQIIEPYLERCQPSYTRSDITKNSSFVTNNSSTVFDWPGVLPVGIIEDEEKKMRRGSNFAKKLSFSSSNGGWLVYEEVNSKCHLPVINYEDFNQLFHELVSLRVPFLVRNVTNFAGGQLPLVWSKQYLREHFNDIDLLAGSIPYGEIFGEPFGVASVGEFLAYMERYSLRYKEEEVEELDDKLPLYVFDSEVMEGEFKSYFKIPDIYYKLNDSKFYHQFILGPRGSGAPFHFHCSAINYLAYGRKKWFLYPPGRSVYSKVHPLHWYIKYYHFLPKGDQPLECMQGTNEIVFVPSRWAHSTLNIDECIGMATEFDTNNC